MDRFWIWIRRRDVQSTLTFIGTGIVGLSALLLSWCQERPTPPVPVPSPSPVVTPAPPIEKPPIIVNVCKGNKCPTSGAVVACGVDPLEGVKDLNSEKCKSVVVRQ